MTERSISVEDAREFSQSLAQIGEGWWRQVAWAFRQGIHDALGMTRREWAQTYHGYLRLEVEDRREAVAELTTPVEDGGMGLNNVEAADVLGVDEKTIRNDRKPESEDSELSPDSPMLPQVADPFFVGESENSEDTAEAKSTRELLAQSDENEWYTPRRFIEAATEVLGGIDLDPASSETANEIVGASRIYTIHDNGLTQPWKGTVWLNPPYGGENRLFVEHAIREYEAGNVTAALLLVNCHPAETAWFQRLFDYTLCFVRGRIDFSGPARERASTSTHGSAIAYLGPDWQRFARNFERFGSVVRRADIRNRLLVAANLWDWKFLNPVFAPTSARPCDIDGWIEQDGHLLLMEGKPPGYGWPQGNAQFRTLKTFSSKPGCSAVVLYGSEPHDPDNPVVSEVEPVLPGIPKHQPRRTATNEDVVAWTRRWWDHTHRCQNPGGCFYDFLRGDGS